MELDPADPFDEGAVLDPRALQDRRILTQREREEARSWKARATELREELIERLPEIMQKLRAHGFPYAREEKLGVTVEHMSFLFFTWRRITREQRVAYTVTTPEGHYAVDTDGTFYSWLRSDMRLGFIPIQDAYELSNDAVIAFAAFLFTYEEYVDARTPVR